MGISLKEKHVQFDQTHRTNWARAILTISTSFVPVNQYIIVVIVLRCNTHSNIATSIISFSHNYKNWHCKILSHNHIVNFSCTPRDWVDFFGNRSLQLTYRNISGWKNQTTVCVQLADIIPFIYVFFVGDSIEERWTQITYTFPIFRPIRPNIPNWPQ